jgi:hypothetical protein
MVVPAEQSPALTAEGAVLDRAEPAAIENRGWLRFESMERQSSMPSQSSEMGFKLPASACCREIRK